MELIMVNYKQPRVIYDTSTFTANGVINTFNIVVDLDDKPFNYLMVMCGTSQGMIKIELNGYHCDKSIVIYNRLFDKTSSCISRRITNKVNTSDVCKIVLISSDLKGKTFSFSYKRN